MASTTVSFRNNRLERKRRKRKMTSSIWLLYASLFFFLPTPSCSVFHCSGGHPRWQSTCALPSLLFCFSTMAVGKSLKRSTIWICSNSLALVESRSHDAVSPLLPHQTIAISFIHLRSFCFLFCFSSKEKGNTNNKEQHENWICFRLYLILFASSIRFVPRIRGLFVIQNILKKRSRGYCLRVCSWCIIIRGPDF